MNLVLPIHLFGFSFLFGMVSNALFIFSIFLEHEYWGQVKLTFTQRANSFLQYTFIILIFA